MDEFLGFLFIVVAVSILSLIGWLVYKYYDIVESVVEHIYAIVVILGILMGIAGAISFIMSPILGIPKEKCLLPALGIIGLVILIYKIERQPSDEYVAEVTKFCKEENLLMTSLFLKLDVVARNASTLNKMERQDKELVLIQSKIKNMQPRTFMQEQLKAPYIYYKNLVVANE